MSRIDRGGTTDDAPPARSQTTSVNGLAVSRRRPAAPVATVVFVHGAMDRAASFARVMRRLGDFDVIAYDRRGYAGSCHHGRPGDGSPGMAPPDADPSVAGSRDPLCGHVNDLAAVLDWACASAPTLPRVVVGHSLGALIALVAVATACPSPSPVGTDVGIIAAGAPPIPDAPMKADAVCVFEPPLPWLDPGYVTSGSRAIDIADTDGPQAAAEFFYRSAVGDRTWNRLSDSDRAIRRSEGDALVSELRAARATRRSLPLPSDRHALHVARGDQGPVHLREAAETLAEAAGVECDVIAGASHGAHLQHPDRFARWVRSSALLGLGAEGRA